MCDWHPFTTVGVGVSPIIVIGHCDWLVNGPITNTIYDSRTPKRAQHSTRQSPSTPHALSAKAGTATKQTHARLSPFGSAKSVIPLLYGEVCGAVEPFWLAIDSSAPRLNSRPTAARAAPSQRPALSHASSSSSSYCTPVVPRCDQNMLSSANKAWFCLSPVR